MAPPYKGPRKQVLVRMPFALYDRIKATSNEKGLNLNDTLLTAITKGLGDRDGSR